MKITIEIPILTTEDVRPDEIILLLRDALSDFCRARCGRIHNTPFDTARCAQEYVDERYREQSLAFRERKLHAVIERFNLAYALSTAISSMEVE